MPFESGARLGPYEIVSPLGEGGMGAVYRARDTRLDRTVAIKVLTGALAADPEFRAAARSRSAGDRGAQRSAHLHDSRRRARRRSRLPRARVSRRRDAPRSPPPNRRRCRSTDAVAIALQIGEALQRAHRTGIVHRDLKPGNVMLITRAGATVPARQAARFRTRGADRGRQSRTALDAALSATMAPVDGRDTAPDGNRRVDGDRAA